MKKGTKVSWKLGDGFGFGEVITDEENGKVLVSVHSLAGEPNPGYHQVICCTVTWLTIETPAV